MVKYYIPKMSTFGMWMFYDWHRIFYSKPLEHPCVAVCPSLCVGKEDKKEIKTLGSPPGDL
jgi:hypothetical protein